MLRPNLIMHSPTINNPIIIKKNIINNNTVINLNKGLKLIVYIKNNQKYIDQVAAYTLNLIHASSISSESKLFDITDQQLDIVKQKYISIKYIDYDKESSKFKDSNYIDDISLNEQVTKLKIYIDQNNQKYIKQQVAYALGLTKVRYNMLNKKAKYYAISDEHVKLFYYIGFDIEYVTILNNEITNKISIKVMCKNNDYFIELSVAYAINLISIEEYYAKDTEWYQIDELVLNHLYNQYEVELIKEPIKNR